MYATAATTDAVTTADTAMTPARRGKSAAMEYPTLDAVTSPTLNTNQAAHYLNRRPQTLRLWACLENGPIRPTRIHGRLAWRVEDIRRLLA